MAQGFLKLGVIWPYGKAMHPAQRADEEAVSFYISMPIFQVECRFHSGNGFFFGAKVKSQGDLSASREAISHVSC